MICESCYGGPRGHVFPLKGDKWDIPTQSSQPKITRSNPHTADFLSTDPYYFENKDNKLLCYIVKEVYFDYLYLNTCSPAIHSTLGRSFKTTFNPPTAFGPGTAADRPLSLLSFLTTPWFTSNQQLVTVWTLSLLSTNNRNRLYDKKRKTDGEIKQRAESPARPSSWGKPPVRVGNVCVASVDPEMSLQRKPLQRLRPQEVRLTPHPQCEQRDQTRKLPLTKL